MQPSMRGVPRMRGASYAATRRCFDAAARLPDFAATMPLPDARCHSATYSDVDAYAFR